jgi:hypothetical protein
MMGKSYQRKTRRSRRKMQDLANHEIRVEMAEEKACFLRYSRLSRPDS